MKERILFVDDEPEVLDGLRRSMRKMHEAWDMEFVPGAEEALSVLKEQPYHAVVADLRMPKMDGMELLARLQKLYPRTGRIVLTAAMDRETVNRGRELAQDYLVKPCNGEMLIAIIKVRLGIERLRHGREKTPPPIQPQPPPRPTKTLLAPLDINQAIESAINITRLEWLDVADVFTELDPDLAPVHCMVAELRLVLLNMIVNAAHEIAQSVGPTGPKGTIRIRTRSLGSKVEILVSDTATRIPEVARARVFDPSFDWDDGPGPWLSVAHEVVGQHGGTLTFESMPERGTAFTISLPT